MKLGTVDTLGMPGILGQRMQIGMVVNDIEAAASFWVEEMGIGPWISIAEAIGNRRFVYRGEDSEAKISVAFSYSGETQLELIAQTNSAPSPYREFLDSGREGFHHLGFWPENFEGSCETLEKAGFEELCSIYLPNGTKNGTYYTGPPLVGSIIELSPFTKFRRTYMTAIESLASTWDGSTRPLRRFASRDEFIASDDFKKAVYRLPAAPGHDYAGGASAIDSAPV